MYVHINILDILGSQVIMFRTNNRIIIDVCKDMNQPFIPQEKEVHCIWASSCTSTSRTDRLHLRRAITLLPGYYLHLSPTGTLM